MCNLYSSTKGLDTIGKIVDRLECGQASGFEPLPAIFSDQIAPVISRDAAGLRAIERMRWGFPPLPYWPCRGAVLTVRDGRSAYWRQWLGAGHRCLVPATAFCARPDNSDVPTWFAQPPKEDDLRPLFFFAGLCRTWKGQRGTNEGPVDGEHRLFSFLTTEPNAVVGIVSTGAMPVILTTSAEVDLWLDGPLDEALSLQHPVPDDRLTVVSRGPLLDWV